uniref:hypothetical protein n=1 Tax=Umezakia ovalisporum TaxID=75695 RepID=UPI0039C5D439
EFLVSTPDTNFIATLTTKTKAKIPVFHLNTIVPRLSSDTLKIESTLPIQRYNLDRFNLFEDTLKIKPTQFLNEDFSIQILYPFKEGKSYKLELNDSALQSIYDQFNSSMNLTFTPKTEQELGNLIVDLVYTGKEKQIFQLIDRTK